MLVLTSLRSGWLSSISLARSNSSIAAYDEGIFPRNIPGKDQAGLTRTLSIFYGNIVAYDLTKQWILNEGAFTYDYAWLSQAHSAEHMTKWAKEIFHHLYGVSPDDFDILQP
jgi:hypothetical protein